MAIPYDATSPAPRDFAPVEPNPPERGLRQTPIRPGSSGGGFAAAALVAMVFVVVAVLFATIPNSTLLSKPSVPAAGAVIVVPGN